MFSSPFSQKLLGIPNFVGLCPAASFSDGTGELQPSVPACSSPSRQPAAAYRLRQGPSGGAASISNWRKGARAGVSTLSSRRRQGLQVTPLVAGSRRRLWTVATATPLTAVKSGAVIRSKAAVVLATQSTSDDRTDATTNGDQQLAHWMTNLQQIYGEALRRASKPALGGDLKIWTFLVVAMAGELNPVPPQLIYGEARPSKPAVVFRVPKTDLVGDGEESKTSDRIPPRRSGRTIRLFFLEHA
ncbi:hypothetical protein DM860_014987 [Cuscuta australis]|uniref:Uncharacterized protein n=1 Tax=Cuscuta australis TaxID=267555 RepID=A0A328DF32_9ASTE|nr:hypothetical protein DM860_014987 [Cuscuta australis]